MTYTNHSGGAEGSDTEWEVQGEKYGVKTIAYSFKDHNRRGKNQKILTEEELREGRDKAIAASATLKRPWKFIANKPYVMNLISRNWFQVKGAKCVYAIGQFVKGSKELVDGGTGWAVQMARDAGKPVCFFEQNENMWYYFGIGTDGIFVPMYNKTPRLTENFAGIGTREINENGKQAIDNVYKKTFETPRAIVVNPNFVGRIIIEDEHK